MYTIALFTWLGRKLRLVLRDTAYFTLIVGFLLTLPLLFNGSAMADATLQVLHVDPMVAYLVNVGGYAIMLGNNVCVFAVLDTVARVLMWPLLTRLLAMFRPDNAKEAANGQ